MATVHKILHAADIHLDSPLRNLSRYEGAPAERIRGASRVALKNLVDLAIDQQVGLVLIAGDLYDGDWSDQNTGLFFVSQATRLIDAGIALVIIRGNHDAFNKMTVNLRLPRNPNDTEVMLSESKPETREFDLDGLSVAVHGRSYRKQHERGDLVKDYPQALPGHFNVGLLHTSLTGDFEGHQKYAPCTPKQLADFGYDYWALGHIHQRGEHHQKDEAPIVFSGNIQGRKINEPGAKGCVIIEIDSRGQTRRTFHPLDVVRFESCLIDTSSMQRIDSVTDAFEAWLDEALLSAEDRLLVPRVQLTGQTALHHELAGKLEHLEASLRSTAIYCGGEQVWLEKVKLQTCPTVAGPAMSGGEWIDQGILASVIAVVDRLKPTQAASPPSDVLFPLDEETADPSAQPGDWVGEELSVLLSKLRGELGAEEAIVDLDNPDEVRILIEQASAELSDRLRAGGS